MSSTSVTSFAIRLKLSSEVGGGINVMTGARAMSSGVVH